MKKTKKMKQLTEKTLSNVPEAYVFMCSDGQIFRNMSDLCDGLGNMSDEVFSYHSNNQTHDFSNWLKDIIGDEELARDLACQINRRDAAITVNSRIAYLKSKCR
jgi:hypothetical protein